MNAKNGLITAAVVLVLLGISYMVWHGGPTSPAAPGSATTPTSAGGSAAALVPPTPAASAGLPGVLTGTLAVPSNVSVVVTGYVAPNGADTTYWFDYGTANTLGKRSALASAGGGFVTLARPAFLSGLAPNTTYSYRLSAQNSFGTVMGNTYTFTTTATPPPVGSAPTVSTGAATDIARATATLSGHVDPNNAQTTYWFEYGPTQSFGSASAFGAAGSGTDSLAVTIPVASLAAQTKYYYRLNAQNNYGMISGATQSFTTLGPAVSGLPTVSTTAATNVGTSTATLTGRVDPHSAASTYWFEYSTSPVIATVLGTVSATQTLSAEVTTSVAGVAKGLAHNTKYYYRLVVRNPQGTVVGDPVSFTTKR